MSRPSFVRALVAGFVSTVALAAVSEPNMCADCSRLERDLDVVLERQAAYDDAIGELTRARDQLDRQVDAMDVLAGIHVILESVWIPTSEIASACLGGTPIVAALSAFRESVRGSSSSRVTLAAIVSRLGLGGVADTVSLVRFIDQYEDDRRTFRDLAAHMDATRSMFAGLLDELVREEQRIRETMERANCPRVGFSIEDLIGRERRDTRGH